MHDSCCCDKWPKLKCVCVRFRSRWKLTPRKMLWRSSGDSKQIHSFPGVCFLFSNQNWKRCMIAAALAHTSNRFSFGGKACASFQSYAGIYLQETRAPNLAGKLRAQTWLDVFWAQIKRRPWSLTQDCQQWKEERILLSTLWMSSACCPFVTFAFYASLSATENTSCVWIFSCLT